MGVFWRLAPSTRRDHPVEEGVASLGGDPDHDPVGEHLRAAGDRGAVAAGLADDRRRLAGDGRLVDRGDPLDDLAVGGDEVAGLADDAGRPWPARRRPPGSRCRRRSGGGPRSPTASRRSVSAWALPRPSAMASAKLAKMTVRKSQNVMDQAKRLGVGDGLDEGDDRADQDHEHDRVLDLDPGVELLERVDRAPGARISPVEQAAGLGHAVGHRRGRPLAVAAAEGACRCPVRHVCWSSIRRTFRGSAARRSGRARRRGRRSGRR